MRRWSCLLGFVTIVRNRTNRKREEERQSAGRIYPLHHKGREGSFRRQRYLERCYLSRCQCDREPHTEHGEAPDHRCQPHHFTQLFPQGIPHARTPCLCKQSTVNGSINSLGSLDRQLRLLKSGSRFASRLRRIPLRFRSQILRAPSLLLIQVMNQVHSATRQRFARDCVAANVKRLAETLQNRVLNLPHRTAPALAGTRWSSSDPSRIRCRHPDDSCSVRWDAIYRWNVCSCPTFPRNV